MKNHAAMLIFLISGVLAGLTWSNVTEIQQVHDSVLPPKKIDSHGVLSASSPLPDWSDVRLPKEPFYIETLIAVDAGVSRFYGHQPEKLLQAIISMMHAVNLYAAQLNIRVIVVDVVSVKGHNLTLEQFLEWRKDQTGLASHDVAMLIRHRFEGGIAYVNGVCKRTAVGICGFFPEAPFEYASVFFHELAHLLGLTHDIRGDCHCSKKNRLNCLRIDGFEHDCSAQALVDLLPTHDCLQLSTEPLPRTIVPICGNGVVEGDEDCDCGLQQNCDNVFCEARSCRFILHKDYLYKIFTMSMGVLLFSFLLLLKRVIMRTREKKEKTMKKRPSFSRTCPVRPEIVVLPNTAMQNGTLALSTSPLVTNRPAPPIPHSAKKTILDRPIPVSPPQRDLSPPPGYTKMFPAKVETFEKLPNVRNISKELEQLVQLASLPLSSIPPPPPNPTDKPHFYDQPPKE